MSTDTPRAAQTPGPLMSQIVQSLQERAAVGFFDGTMETKDYVMSCIFDAAAAQGKGVRFMYTRSREDAKHHCLHLSLGFREPKTGGPLRFDHRFARRAVPAFFAPPLVDDVIVFPPQEPEGQRFFVWHFFLYTTKDWMPDGYRPVIAPGSPPVYTWAEYSKALFQ